MCQTIDRYAMTGAITKDEYKVYRKVMLFRQTAIILLVLASIVPIIALLALNPQMDDTMVPMIALIWYAVLFLVPGILCFLRPIRRFHAIKKWSRKSVQKAKDLRMILAPTGYKLGSVIPGIIIIVLYAVICFAIII